MPYTSNEDLPKGVQNHLPTAAQNIYRAAFNAAWEEYKDPQKRRDNASREEVAHRVAWAAVEHQYEKNEEGAWVMKK